MVVPLLGAILPAVAQQPDETLPVLSASKILPPGSFGAVQSTFAIAGEHRHVDEESKWP